MIVKVYKSYIIYKSKPTREDRCRERQIPSATLWWPKLRFRDIEKARSADPGVGSRMATATPRVFQACGWDGSRHDSPGVATGVAEWAQHPHHTGHRTGVLPGDRPQGEQERSSNRLLLDLLSGSDRNLQARPVQAHASQYATCQGHVSTLQPHALALIAREDYPGFTPQQKRVNPGILIWR